MKINQKTIRNLIILSCIVLVLFLAGCFSKTAVTPPLPEQPTFTHYRVVTQAYKDSNPAHSIEIAWRANSIDYSFKIFKSLNGGSFEELFDDGVAQLSYYQRKSCSCSFTDIEVQPGNQYSYYVLAYNEKEEIGQTETFTRNIFLPPCTLKEPQDNAEVDTPIPTFSWDNKELTKYLTKSKAEGYLKTHLKVNNETIQEEVWNMTFDDSTVDNVTYNLDDTGEPLVNDNEYEWFHWTDAYDAQGNLIANAYSNSWHFHYKGPIKAVLMGKIMVPETAKSISKDVTGTIPLVGATITITDSEGITHTGTTQAQGQYIFPQVAPGTNYIITAVGEVDSNTIIYKDVVPSIELHEVFDAGVADAESTALALVMEAMLLDDPSLTPEEINLDDILNASSFTSLVSTVDGVLNTYGDVTEDTGVAEAVETVEEELLFFADFEARSHIHRGLNGELGYYAHLLWKPHPDANSYQIYKKVGSSGYTIVDLEINYDEGMNRYGAWDDDISQEIVYEYYIEAVTPTGNITCPPEIVDTWLPATAPVSPAMHSYTTNPTPTFQWESLGISTYPYQDRIWSGDVELLVTDETIGEDVWHIEINGLDVSSVVYDDTRAEEPAVALVEGHEYSWFVIFDGSDALDLAGKEIANSSFRSIFYYGNQIIFDHAMSFIQKFGDSIEHSVSLQWIGYPGTTNYHVYRSINPSSDFGIVEGELEFDEENQITFNDYNEIEYGVIYYYYVEADLLGGEIVSSPTITIDTWFPSFDLTYPEHNTVITESNPTFTWQNPGISFPYPPSADKNGGVHFYVWDATDHIDVWEMQIDLDISTITYNGELLEEGHEYIWGIRYEGDNTTNGLEVANSCSEGRFYYNATNTVFGVEARTAVSKEQENIEYIIKVRWLPYPDVTNYHIYRRVNETGVFEEIFGEYHVLGYGKYEFVDEDVSNVNTYEYYITAETSQGETDPSQIFAVDTWFPTFEVTQPAYNSIVMTTNPTFAWEQLPITLSYGSVKYVDLHFHIWDENTGEDIWTIRFDGNNTTTLVYGQEGDVEGPAEPLIKGHKYSWGIVYDGMDENNEIANSWSSSSFYYQEILFDIHADTVSGCNEYYSVELNWNSSDDYNYEIYRSEDGGTNFGFLTDEYEINEGNNCYYRDEDITENMRYDYKVVMLNNSGDEITHAIVTVDTWLPECESFIPAHGALIPVNSLQVFSWTFPPDFEFPYNGKIYFEDSHFWIYDKISGQEVYHTYEDEVWIDSITYDCSGLTSGNEYGWHFEFWGTDSEWNTGAGSAFGGSFFYGSKPFIVNASSITGNSGDHQIEVRWPIYQGASDYRVFRSTNGGSYDMIFDSYGETPDFYDNTIDWWINQGVDFSFCTDGVNINIIDFTVTENNSYSYYVVAYGGSLQDEISSNKTIAINTWLPACWLVAPDDGSTITDSHPLLEWSPPGIETYELPYGQIFEGQMHLQVVNLTDSEEVWDVDFYDLTTSSIIYDGNPLLAEYSYIWRWYPVGLDQNGQFIAEAIGGTRQFTYNGE